MMEKQIGGKPARMIGFEVLRIISAMMIVCMHCIGHGGLGSSAPANSAAYMIYWGIFFLCRVSTCCFVMISGYFLSASRAKPGNVFRLFVQVLFYSILTFAVACLGGHQRPSLFDVVHAVTPVSSYIYWFASCYIMMYLAVPLLNIIVEKLDRRQFRVLLVMLFLIFSVWPTVLFWSQTTFVENGYSYLWFFVLYLTAAYIRRFQVFGRPAACALVYLACSLLSLAIRVAVARIRPDMSELQDTLGGYQSPMSYIAAVAFFLLFQRMDIRSGALRKIIIYIASGTFGVYLLHDSDHIRDMVWSIADMTRYGTLGRSLLYMAAVIVLITAAGALVDAVYRKLYSLLRLKKLEDRINSIRLFDQR